MPVDIQQPAVHVAQAAVISADWAAAERRPAPPPPQPKAKTASEPKPAPPLVLADPRIKAAVAETLAASPDKADVAPNQQDALRTPMLSAESYKTFSKGFAYAKVPYCLGDNGLKFLPPMIGPIGVTGLLAIPWVVAAKLRGKCK